MTSPDEEREYASEADCFTFDKKNIRKIYDYTGIAQSLKVGGWEMRVVVYLNLIHRARADEAPATRFDFLTHGPATDKLV